MKNKFKKQEEITQHKLRILCSLQRQLRDARLNRNTVRFVTEKLHDNFNCVPEITQQVEGVRWN